MVRALLLAFVLAALPAAAFLDKIEKWADKQSEKFIEEGRKEKVRALSSRNADERLDAVEFFSGQRDPDSVAALGRALSDPDARVRQAAASGLWRIEKDAEPARAQLVKALDDADPNVAARAAGALQAMGMKETELAAPRRRVLDSRAASDSSRFLVARNLVGEEPPIKLLYPMLTYLEANARGSEQRDNVELAQQALEHLVKQSQDRSLVEPLVAEVRKAKPGQAILVRTLGFFQPKPERWAETLVGVLDSSQPRAPYAALGQMRDLRQERDVRVWAPRAAAMLRHPDSSVRSEALWALGAAGGLAAAETDSVVAALADGNESVRRSAARALGEMGERNQAVPAAAKARVAMAARPALTTAMESDGNADVRSEAKSALAKLGAGGTPPIGAPAGPAVPNYTENAPGSEAGGMALLRSRKVSFEPTSFFRALSEQDVALVRAFLDAGMSAKDPLLDMGPPIRVMIFSGTACDPRERPTKPGTKELVKLLIDRGADVNGSDKNGNTPLSEAASKGCDRELIRLLIKAGAKINATNAAGLTPFEMGLWMGHDGLEELIAAGYRLPAAKVKDYNTGYKDRPASLAMIRKATAK